MKAGDFLMKKWCFGVGTRRKKWIEQNSSGEADIVQRYPRYRTIVLEILDAKKEKNNAWLVEANQYASLNAKPKKVKLKLAQNKNKSFSVTGQKTPFHKIEFNGHTEEGMPPVGSLITLNKKHAIVTATGRNGMTVWMGNKYHDVSIAPGSVRWKTDKIIANIKEQ